MIPVLLLLLTAADWSKPQEFYDDETLAITYRAMFDGEALIVEAAIEPKWHTFCMDNRRRHNEKLAGRQSLGVEKPTAFEVKGAAVTGPWYQSPPQDFSKPQLLMFTYGFEKQARFAVKAKPEGAGPIQVTVKAQACSASTCKNVDLTLEVPVDPKATPESPSFTGLEPVKL